MVVNVPELGVCVKGPFVTPVFTFWVRYLKFLALITPVAYMPGQVILDLNNPTSAESLVNLLPRPKALASPKAPRWFIGAVADDSG